MCTRTQVKLVERPDVPAIEAKKADEEAEAKNKTDDDATAKMKVDYNRMIFCFLFHYPYSLLY